MKQVNLVPGQENGISSKAKTSYRDVGQGGQQLRGLVTAQSAGDAVHASTDDSKNLARNSDGSNTYESNPNDRSLFGVLV